jgi:hypothetical protein
LAHLNTIVAHLNPAYQPTNVAGPPIQHIYTSNPNSLLSFFQSCRRCHPPSVSLPPPPLHRFVCGPCGGSTAAEGPSRKAAAAVGVGFGGGHAPLPWGAVGRRGSVAVMEWAVGSSVVGRRRGGQALPSWMRQRGRREPLPWGAAIRPPGWDFVSLFCDLCVCDSVLCDEIFDLCSFNLLQFFSRGRRWRVSCASRVGRAGTTRLSDVRVVHGPGSWHGVLARHSTTNLSCRSVSCQVVSCLGVFVSCRVVSCGPVGHL